MRGFIEFLGDEAGRVNAGGPVIYIIILGVFVSVVTAIGADDGPRRLAGHAGPTLELDIRGLVEDTFGGPLPQDGPLSGGR